MIFPTNITKEDFKRAYTSCLKEAWIFHNETNFKQAVDWKHQHLFTYNVKSEVEEDEFETNASSINIFEVFQEVYQSQDLEKLQQWNEKWQNAEGFELLDYAGDAIIDGNEVGEYARKYFEYQLEEKNLNQNLHWESIDLQQFSFQDALKQTQAVLTNNHQIKFLFEAAFEYDNLNLKTRCDVLELVEDNHVNLYEVKATSKVKKEHFYDVVYQTYILEKNGFIVDNIYLVTLNPEYVVGFDYEFEMKEAGNKVYEQYEHLTYEEVVDDIKNNDLLIPFTNEPKADLDLSKTLFIHDEFKKMEFIEAYRLLDQNIGIKEMLDKLAKTFALPTNQVLTLLKKDNCVTPLDLKNTKKVQEFFYKTNNEDLWCFHVLPWYDETRETVFNLTGNSGFNAKVKASIFYQTGKLYLDDIKALEGLNLVNKANKDIFGEQHYRIFDVYKKQQAGNLQPKDILNVNYLTELKSLLQDFFQEPNIYMYDFETAKWALPRFWHSKTYQQIPFQYSVDIISDDNYDYHHPETMKHHDFLSSKLTDPRPDFIVHFINDMLMKHGKGVYVAYNMAFEKMVLKYLAVQFPKYAKPLIYIAAHTIDLMDFFKGKKADEAKNQDYRPWFLIYHPNFHGSYSIKKTQPALDPSLNYDDLTINKGDKASQTFRQYLDGGISQDAWDEDLKPNMINYCNRDTLAMVVILKQVENLLSSYENRS